MRSFILIAPLLLAACATTPPIQAPPRQATPPAPPTVQQTGPLIGLTTGQLAARFGSPDLTVREGAGLKLQFRLPSCVLDAYLYNRGGQDQVTHVDTRDIYGRDVPSEGCIAAMDRERAGRR